MLNLSIMPLDGDHIEELCADAIEQQKNGVSTHAMFMMKFAPEGTPPVDKAAQYCELYDEFRARLERQNAKCGVLVQSTFGHVTPPNVPHPFQTVVSLVNGEPLVSTCCPLDRGFRKYLKDQMHTLATHAPSVIMIDDDIGLLYRDVKGCACPLHMAEFNRRAGTNMTREELYRHTQGTSEEDRRYTEIYVQLIADATTGAIRAMREGIDEADPRIQGVVSGIFTGTFCEFSDRTAEAFAGEGNPKILRMNNGVYTESARGFTKRMYRAAMLKNYLGDRADILLAETDTCPHNRYSTGASLLHAHFTASILEGAKGAKHWITRLAANEPASGRAYRKIFAKYSKFYEALCGYADELRPVGCRIPLSSMQDYGFVPARSGINISPWSTCVLERFGLPLYFSSAPGGTVFLDDVSVAKFTDEEIREFFGGTLVLSAGAAEQLTERGFGELLGVSLADRGTTPVSFEVVDGHRISCQRGMRRLIPHSDKTEVLSDVIHLDGYGNPESLFPAVTAFDNAMGGCTVVFGGTPDTNYNYIEAFAMLNESRKRQMVKLLQRAGDLPIYYPGDAEVYLRAGMLPSRTSETGELMAALFNLGTDVLDTVELVCDRTVTGVELLTPDGTRRACTFTQDGNTVSIEEPVGVLLPAIFFLR